MSEPSLTGEFTEIKVVVAHTSTVDLQSIHDGHLVVRVIVHCSR